MLPIIMKPTRISKSSATLIDNIIISEKLQSDYRSNILFSNLSDHLPCHFAGKKEATKIKERKLNKDNLNKIKNEIQSIDWENMLNGVGATKSFDIVHNNLISIINKFAPEIEVRVHHT